MEVETHPYGEGIVHAAMSGVDMAVWDALGRRRDLPIAELLGGAVHDAVPVYASFTWLGEEGAVRRDARRAVEAGFRAIKLHEHEPGLVAAARDEVGDDVAVMLDVSGRFDVTAAVAAARAYQAFDLEWLEEPVFPMRDHRALAAVRAQIEIPIAAGENEYTVEGFERLLTARAVDVVQPEIAKFGGCTPAMPVAALAAEHEVALCPHNFSLGPSFYASLQWALAAPQTRWLEMPLMPPGYVFPSGLTGPAATEGRMALPTLPGLGMPESFYRAVA
jgi:L-alanine-DL-glutamate epimerase-like enolase superfamily enzyme